MSAKDFKKTTTRGVKEGLRLVQDTEAFWSDFDRDHRLVIEKLKTYGLPGADLLSLDPGIKHPKGEDLNTELEETMKDCIRLDAELDELIRASKYDAISKKIILELIKSYGVSMERRGAFYTQFELRSADQYAAIVLAEKRAGAKKQNSPREKRLKLIQEWIKANLPKITTREEIYERREAIVAWLRAQGGSPPNDANKQRNDLRGALELWLKAKQQDKTVTGHS